MYCSLKYCSIEWAYAEKKASILRSKISWHKKDIGKHALTTQGLSSPLPQVNIPLGGGWLLWKDGYLIVHLWFSDCQAYRPSQDLILHVVFFWIQARALEEMYTIEREASYVDHTRGKWVLHHVEERNLPFGRLPVVHGCAWWHATLRGMWSSYSEWPFLSWPQWFWCRVVKCALPKKLLWVISHKSLFWGTKGSEVAHNYGCWSAYFWDITRYGRLIIQLIGSVHIRVGFSDIQTWQCQICHFFRRCSHENL